MGTRVGIIGKCPYCNRHVANDLRPINELNTRDARRIAQLIEDATPETQVGSNEDADLHMEAAEEGDVQSMNSLSRITGTILDMVREEFDVIPDESGPSRITNENAEVILAMLNEEEIQEQAGERDAIPPPKRRRRN
ncbi:hypothetical protein KR009_000883 [Drosophila setifemur]|nr:hypothetical protein KR009_000883 [Drosophila setifemur]